MTDRILFVVFLRFRGFRSQKAKRSYAHAPEREPVLGPMMRVTPLGLRVIVNEKSLNLEKTVLSDFPS